MFVDIKMPARKFRENSVTLLTNIKKIFNMCLRFNAAHIFLQILSHVLFSIIESIFITNNNVAMVITENILNFYKRTLF